MRGWLRPCVCVAESSTNATDTVRAICVVRASVSMRVSEWDYFYSIDKEKPHNSRLFSDDQSIYTTNSLYWIKLELTCEDISEFLNIVERSTNVMHSNKTGNKLHRSTSRYGQLKLA